MSFLRRIISMFTGSGRRRTRGTRTTGGAQNSQDAQIGKAVRKAANKATGKR